MRYDELFKLIYLTGNGKNCEQILAYYLKFLAGIYTQLRSIVLEIGINTEMTEHFTRESINHIDKRRKYIQPIYIKWLIHELQYSIKETIWDEKTKTDLNKYEELLDLLQINYTEFFKDVKKCLINKRIVKML